MAALRKPLLEALQNVEQLSPRVVRVLGLNPGQFTLQGTNTYIVGTGNERILIDTGVPDKPDYVSLLKNTLDNLKVRLSHVIITHWHNDHVGGAGPVCRLSVDSPPLLLKYPRPAGIAEPDVDTPFSFSFLTNGQILNTDGATLRVVATPGHTDDHIALFLEEEQAVFTGDCVLGQGTAVFEDLKDYMDSLSLLLRLNPQRLYPGHGPVINNGMETIEEYVKHRLEREKQIIDVLKTSTSGLTSMEIVERVYKDTDKSLWNAAEGNVLHHLEKLMKEGIVEKISAGGDSIKWKRILAKI